MESGKYYQVDLTEPGVPANAKILARNYTGRNDDMTAVEWYANAPRLRFPGTTLRLLGVPLGEGLLPRVGRVSINVVSMPDAVCGALNRMMERNGTTLSMRVPRLPLSVPKMRWREPALRLSNLSTFVAFARFF